MKYTDRFELSREAKQAAEAITKGLLDRARKDGRIPEMYLFWADTDAPEINDELKAAGFMKWAASKDGVEVYEHPIDADALRAALGWTKN